MRFIQINEFLLVTSNLIIRGGTILGNRQKLKFKENKGKHRIKSIASASLLTNPDSYRDSVRFVFARLVA